MNQDINGDFRGAGTICGCKMYVYEKSSSVICAFCGHYPIKHLLLIEKEEQCEASNSCKHLESVEKQDIDSDPYEQPDSADNPPILAENVEESTIHMSISYNTSSTSASDELIITSANIASDLSEFEKQFITEKEKIESEEHSNNIYVLDRENKTVKCSLCNIKLNLQKSFTIFNKHVLSDTHQINLELNDPSIEESKYLNLLKDKFPDILVTGSTIKKISCRICTQEFEGSHKNLCSNIQQHMNSEKHTKLKAKRPYTSNTKEISSFFEKKKKTDTQKQAKTLV